MPSALFDFQRFLVEWSVRKGRAAIFADCGLGKSAMQLTWAANVVRHTAKPVLLLTPLAVAGQMLQEAEKFGVEAVRSNNGQFTTGAKTVVTNYERLHHFDPLQFSGIVCDESSILKNCDGATRELVTNFARKMSYRLLCTATPSPNDLIELGTSSEALGYMGFNDMLTTFFKKDEDRRTNSRKDEFRSGIWRFRGHAAQHFYQWVNAWARAIRKPSDLGAQFSDARYILPELVTHEIMVACETPPDGFLFNVPASGLQEQRQERRRTLELRCQAAADKHNANPLASVAWCQLNDEGNTLEKMINGAVQVSGSDEMEYKEECFEAFANGKIKKLVTKGGIAGFGLNWAHCAHQSFFPSHSFEEFYQCIRRSWRFGQTKEVHVDLVTSEGESGVMANLMRKASNAELLYSKLVAMMGRERDVILNRNHNQQLKVPTWLS